MKTHILLAVFALYSGLSLAATVTITNSGATFAPNDVSVASGDIIDFQLESMHNAVEVSESTWLANGNTPLPGFSVPFGGGEVHDLAPGVHYYVCTPHAEFGMKGKITVTPLSGVAEQGSDSELFKLYPNPFHGDFFIQLNDNIPASDFKEDTDGTPGIEIAGIKGDKIFSMPEADFSEPVRLDMAAYPAGIYFIRITDNKRTFTKKVLKN